MKRKVLFPLTILGLLLSSSACGPLGGSLESTEDIVYSSEKGSDSQQSIVNSSSSIKSSEESISSSIISSSSEIKESTFLESNPTTCDNHVLEDEIIKPATIIESGVVRHKCKNCGGFNEEVFYDLNEFDFKDRTFAYDGNGRTISIEGLLPYGCTVSYENNTLKEKGNKIATAKIFSPEGKLLITKTATISIVDNIGLPQVKVVTGDGTDPDWKNNSDGERPYKAMKVSINNCAESFLKNEIAGEIKVRGNSTNQESVAKRAFRLKLGSKTNLLGLNDGLKEKSWVLLADFFDQSRFRNLSAFEMGNSLFNYSGYYSSDFQHVKLFMNGEDRGVYLLAEQQQAKKGRFPIREADGGETGTDIGYLLEIDGLVSQQGHIDRTTGLGTLEGDPCFQTDSVGSVKNVNIGSKPYVIKTDTYSDEQRQFIRKYMNNCMKAFANTLNNKLQIVNENAEIVDSPYTNMFDTLNSFIDLDSFFRMFLLQEFMKDYDVGWGSFYLYVDFSANSKIKRLTMAAPWDFDLGVGNKQSGNSWGGWGGWGGQQSGNDKEIPTSGISSTQDNFLKGSEYANGMTTFNPWLFMLSQGDFFNEMFKKYYSSFNASGVYERMVKNIEYERVAFANEFDDNHARYGKGASGATLMQTRQYDSHKDAVDYLLKWISERKSYLDKTYL